MIDTINFDKMNGLVPAIVQDAKDGVVLMVGYMNREALEHTIEGKQVVFWSRTKLRLWKKGETSGNFLDVVSVTADCDKDALLITARPAGVVCHTGKKSCFGNGYSFSGGTVLETLENTIQKRKSEMPEDSYTADLFRKGISMIAQKVGEEAIELAIAAQYKDERRCVEEAADLLYHFLVLLAEKGIVLKTVEGELESRMSKEEA